MALWIPAALMAAIVASLWGPNLMRPPPPAWTPYASVRGQIRRVVLADKSVMLLNGASQARVMFGDSDRRVALGQAEAALTIAANARRPFVIAAGDREARLDSGEVNVLRQTTATGARTALTVRKGQARVYAQGQPPAAGLALGPNQEASWTDGQAQPTVRAVNAANAFAWEEHRFAYDKAPLGEVIADLNRHVARPIRLGDPSLAALPFTGAFPEAGEEVMLRQIAAVLPIEIKSLPAELVVQRRAPCPAGGCRKPARKSLFGARPKPRAAAHLLPVPPPPTSVSPRT